MNIDTVKLVYFSPTGTTRKILNGISDGFCAGSIEQIDLTLPTADTLAPADIQKELVIFGVPVYEGRVSKTAIARLQQFKGNKTPAVIVVMYGNRDYEDALLELNDLTREMGFLPIAGAAFVGEHSFANANRPLANGRPDAKDMQAAKEFGSKIQAKMKDMAAIDESCAITPPGNIPYIEHDGTHMKTMAATTLVENCILCGSCATVCPVGAICVEDAVTTDITACILCNACVKNCLNGARVVDDPMANKIANWVSRNFQARRDPVTFI
ncbi:MAG: 4Fe-4S binding protein [Proteobacteria bacterium]|nr:4Fe-4S binding protein [Pseudomonadota bacterium]MBU1388434.1 4Fe-4S binding protein [Pseudomonadota bacterium]MBU1542742.1 4Fe-4S binding protein [Pseudomonadota bacterium]MBU2429986.1 4Fe-4S binding protein [Pseudomonadota bacterium]MBU2481276.1 4Fe-4S binding protein [Pseudomonadota bacterium]